MATKLNGVVIYRELRGDEYMWAVRVYRNGNTIFQACEVRRSLAAAVSIARLVSGTSTIRVQIGPAFAELEHRYSYQPVWLSGWLRTQLAKEDRRLKRRQQREANAFFRRLSRSNVSVRTRNPSYVKPNPRYT